MIRSSTSTSLRHATTSPQLLRRPYPPLTARSVRSIITHRRTSRKNHETPSPAGTTPIPKRDEPGNPRSSETDPIPTVRDAKLRARQLEDIEVPGLMPELQEAILRHPGVEATMVVREEKIPRELEVGEETQHASGFIPPTPGLPRKPQRSDS